MAVASAPNSGMTKFPLVIALSALAATGAVVVLAERFYRELEVRLAGAILEVITTSGVYVAPDRESVYFGLSGTAPFGLRMTPECSSAFLLLPLLVVTMVMVYFRPANAKRLFFSLGVSALVVVLVNQLRILTIVGLVHGFGTDEGYYWGHTLLGSMVSVVGGAVSLVLFVRLATRNKKA